jgi:hypothetical protein
MSTANNSSTMTELCDRIRAAIARPESVSRALVADLAAAYSEHAEEVSHRLRRAVGWIRLGLISEALHDIEQFPDALDAASTLELGLSKGTWLDMCRANDVQPPSTVDSDIAAEVGAAYRAASRWRPLLGKHRRLALAGAALSARVKAVRALAKADPDNTAWAEQRALLERGRLTEVLAEANTAVARCDPDRLTVLLDELSDEHWQQPPPAKLKAAVRGRQQAAIRRVAVRRLGELAEELHEAHGALDEDRVATLMPQWDAAAARAGTEAPPDAIADAGAIRAWLDGRCGEQERRAEFDRLVAEVGQAIDDGEPFAEIERRYAKLAAADLPVPGLVERRFRQREREYCVQSRHRHRVVAGSMVGVLLILGSVVAWILYSQFISRGVSRWSAEIAAALDAGNTEQGRQLFERLDGSSPSVAVQPEIQSLRARMLDAIEKTDQSDRALAAALAKLDTASYADPATWEALDRAEKLARTPAQRLATQTRRDRLEGERSAAQRRIDEPFRTERGRLVQAHRALDERKLADADLVAPLRALVGEFDRLLATAGVSEEETRGPHGPRALYCQPRCSPTVPRASWTASRKQPKPPALTRRWRTRKPGPSSSHIGPPCPPGMARSG